jgi:hypothetical protein
LTRDVEQLLALIVSAYNRQSWHGTNLRGSIRGVSARLAARRPAPARHNIWELVVHAAYWKYIALRRLTGASRGSFPIEGSNWFERDGSGGEKAWRSDIALLDGAHKALRREVGAISSRDLAATPAGSRVSNFKLLSGVAAHDLYHAGQIQLLKRLQR